MATYIPIINMLKGYKWISLRTDAVGGFLVAIILMPQAVAYSYLAGVPAEYGLYASIFPVILYGIFGTFPQLSLGPVAISSILIFSAVSLLSEPFSSEYISLVILLGLMVGVAQFAIGVFRLGFLVNYLSLPVLSGVIAGAVIVIVISQLNPLLGLSNDGQGTIGKLTDVISNVSSLQPASTIIGTVSLVVIFISKKWNWKVPGTLIVVVLATVITYSLQLDQHYGVDVVGSVQGGFPQFKIPQITLQKIELLLPAALVVTLINCVESLTIAKGISLRNKDVPLHADKELRGTGIVKIISAFFQAIPASASFSRSAIYEDRGVTSGIATIISGVLVLLTMLFFTFIIYYIPVAVLAAIIIGSVFRLVDIAYGHELWRIKKSDFYMYLSAMLISIVVGIEYGVLFGVLFSFALMLYKSSRPKSYELGLIKGTDIYRNLNRFTDAKVHKDYMVVRFDARLYFANADFFLEKMLQHYRRRDGIKYFILCAENINQIDTTGLHVLREFAEALLRDDVKLLITGAKGVLRDLFAKADFYKIVPPHHHFMKIADAATFVKSDGDFNWHSGAIQTDV